MNDITVWSGGPQPNADRANAYLALPKIRAALASGDYATAQRLVAANMTTTGRGDSAYDASYETLGDLTIDSSLGAEPITGYWRWLDLATAVSGVEFTADGKIYRRETFSSAPDHMLVTHLTCDRPGQISFTLKLSRVVSATTVSDGDDTLTMRGNTDVPATQRRTALKGNLDYEVRVRVKTVGGRVRSDGDSLVVSGADEATILLAAGTTYILDYEKNYRGPDPHQLITRQLNAASVKPYEDLKKSERARLQTPV